MRLIKIAGRDDYLRNLGVPDEVIAYVMSLPDTESIYLTNALRRAPMTSVDDLKKIQMPNQPFPIQDYERESVRFNVQNVRLDLSPRMTDWFVMQIRKRIPSQLTLLKDNRPVDETLVEEEKYKAFKVFYLNRFSSELASLSRVGFWDWYRMAPDRDLTGGTLDDALRMNEEWHESFKGKEGTGHYRELNIVYGPTWIGKDGPIKKWEGWTIREITTESDLVVEGDKMGHCCGGYWDKYENRIKGSDGGISKIFSLRDSGNEPHVTIETNESGETAYQIQGKENTEPDDEYAEMIECWTTYGGSPIKNIHQDEYVEIPDSQYLTSFMDELEEFETNTTAKNRYGLAVDVDFQYSYLDDIFDNGIKAVMNYNDRGWVADNDFSYNLLSILIDRVTDDQIREFYNDKLVPFMDNAYEEFQDNFSSYNQYPEDADEDSEEMREYYNEEEFAMEQDARIQLSKEFFDDFKTLMKEKKGVEDIHLWLEKKEESVTAKNWYNNFLKGVR